MSEGSVSTTSSRIKQFGLYRTIDARTEEFLRLSRKRQIRQGCACAAVSTAITVTIVVVVLLIYEYMIAVETHLVQNKRQFNLNHTESHLPVADRLDRSNFGFDQDYYEKMPLLVNGLQESNYIDPTAEISVAGLKSSKKTKTIYIRPTAITHVNKFHENKFIRKTRPRPFDFEYRSPYPQPFSKSNGNRNNWAESFRNAERLKNLREVIKYLEKTLNAKFGDMYLPNKGQIAFSGVFVSPMNAEDVASSSNNDQIPQSSRNVEVKTNHKSDPLYNYRPDNPGDINLLADGYKFSPTLFSTLHRKKTIHTQQKSFPDVQKKCFGIECDNNNYNNRNIDQKKYLRGSESVTFTTEKPSDKSKSFRVMLNLMPLKTPESGNTKIDNEREKIYITTSKPWFYFKRKSIFPVRRTVFRSDRTKYIMGKQENGHVPLLKNTGSVPEVTVNLNVYSTLNEKKARGPTITNKSDLDVISISASTSTEMAVGEYRNTNDREVLNSSNVEDYHVGSSGIIPIELRPNPMTYSVFTPIIPLTSTTTATETVFTNAPEIFKFSPEDARVPDQYRNIQKSDAVVYDEAKDYQTVFETENKDVIRETLAIKLRNIVETTTEEHVSEDSTYNAETTTDLEIETTTGTYVPQINGHYRNMKHKILSTMLQENSERYRKKRLENLLIVRKSTQGSIDDMGDIDNSSDE